MEAQGIDVVEVLRMSLILVHVMAVVVAGVGIAFGDYAILVVRRMNISLLFEASRIISVALSLLWMTGLSVIWIDTQFEWEVLANSPKMLAKLAVVSILTLNGVALHLVVFKRLQTPDSDTRRTALFLTLLGAISGVTWLYAVFVGLAKPVAPLLGLSGFLGFYFVALLLSIAVALVLIEPKVAGRLIERLTCTEGPQGERAYQQVSA